MAIEQQIKSTTLRLEPESANRQAYIQIQIQQAHAHSLAYGRDTFWSSEQRNIESRRRTFNFERAYEL